MQNSDEQTIMAIFIVCVDPEENWKGEESEADAVDALDESVAVADDPEVAFEYEDAVEDGIVGIIELLLSDWLVSSGWIMLGLWARGSQSAELAQGPPSRVRRLPLPLRFRPSEVDLLYLSCPVKCQSSVLLRKRRSAGAPQPHSMVRGLRAAQGQGRERGAKGAVFFT